MGQFSIMADFNILLVFSTLCLRKKKFFSQTSTYYIPIDQKFYTDHFKGQKLGLKIFRSRDMGHFCFQGFETENFFRTLGARNFS